MKYLYQTQARIYFAMMVEYMTLQEELLEAKREIIELQKRIDEMTPKNTPDEDIFWHISGGMPSSAAASSDDLATVKRFRDWNTQFAKRHIKPYVNPKVYGECLNQMTRGLAEQIAKLETEQAISKIVAGKTTKSNQLALLS